MLCAVCRRALVEVSGDEIARTCVPCALDARVVGDTATIAPRPAA